MSIKLKIAFYNTFLMGFIVLLLLFFMNTISTWVVDYSSKNQLIFMVQQNAEELEWDDGELELDDVHFFQNHVTTLIYSSEGYLLAGQMPSHTEILEPLRHEEITKITQEGIQYFLYDYLVPSRKYEDIYIRGVISASEVSDSVNSVFLLTLFCLPLFIFFSWLGSFMISKKSMKPLEKIVETAADISHGDDLSRRISLGKGKDELHHLSDTFDTMFSRLEEAFLAEKQFTSDVSHELRTPTAVILAECELCLENEALDQEQRDSLLLIQRQGKKMQTLISVLLNFIRLDNGIQKLQMEEVDLSELIAIVCEEQESLLTSTQTLRTNLPHKILAEVDNGMMIRVLSNLIENGLKYGKEQGFVEISLTEEENTVCITVKDDGIGIAPEHLDKIFHRFYQVESARTRDSSHSLGLGLSMVEQIIRCHHGEITATSTLGEGSTFVITLPKISPLS